jgi:selenophosphate synthase
MLAATLRSAGSRRSHCQRNVSLEISYAAVLLLAGTKNLAAQGIVPSGSKSNHAWLTDAVTYDDSLALEVQLILCDAITSDGLLVSPPEKETHAYAYTEGSSSKRHCISCYYRKRNRKKREMDLRR